MYDISGFITLSSLRSGLVAINLYEQNKICLSQFKFLITSKGL